MHFVGVLGAILSSSTIISHILVMALWAFTRSRGGAIAFAVVSGSIDVTFLGGGRSSHSVGKTLRVLTY